MEYRPTYEHLRIMYDEATTGLILLRDGRYVAVNPAFSRMIGYPPNELVGKRYGDIIEDEYGFEDMRATRVREVERRARTKHGIVHLKIKTHAEPNGFVIGNIVDITTEKERRANLSVMESVIHHAHDAIVITEPTATEADALPRILFANQAFSEITGWKNVEVASRPLSILFGTPFDPAMTAGLVEAMCAVEKRQCCLTALTRDGGEIWIDFVATPVLHEGQCRYWIFFFRDVTAQRTYVTNLIAERNRAEAASRAKSEFLANMSHELRTPMNGIMLSSEMIANRIFGDDFERYFEYAASIHASGEHLLSIINDLLDISKIEAGRYTLEEAEVDLESSINESIGFIAGKANQKGLCVNRTTPPAPRVFADERAIKQILTNLFSNAVKFTADGGEIEIGCFTDRNGVHLTVRDTGIGMTPEVIARIGTKFMQAEMSYSKRFEGTGLGLSLAKVLTELHGGKLSFESELNVGTTVTVTLPVSRLRDTRTLRGINADPARGGD